MKNILLISLLFISVSTFGQFKNNNGRIFNVANYGAFGNARDVTDAGMASNTTVSSATAAFTTADVGKACIMYGSGAAGINQTGTISAYISATQVTVSFTAAATVTNKEFFYGTEATTGIQAAINAADAVQGGTVWFPSGVYFLGGALVTSQNTSNPNCQIYFPYHAFSGQVEYSIDLEGESAVNVPSGYIGTANPTVTTGVVLRSILTGSGSQPAVIAGGDVSHPIFISVWFKKINVQVYTNQGAVAPTMSALWLHNIYKSSGNRATASLDVPNQSSADPSGTETVGIASGFLSDAGPNNWTECTVSGYKYGFILGEHTLLDNDFVFACQYAYTIIRSDFSVAGFALYHACNNGVYFPNATVMGITSGLGRVSDLKFECEIDSAAAIGTHWYNTFVSNISDAGNNGYGVIKTLSVIGGTNTQSTLTVVGGSNLISLPYNSNTDNGFNTATSNTKIGGIGFQSLAADNQMYHSNIYYNGGFKYATTGTGSNINTGGGAFYFTGFPSGSANAAASKTYQHVMFANGNSSFNANGVDNSTGIVQSMSASLPQFAAHYNATNYGTLQTGSTGTMTIVTAGTAGDLVLAPLRDVLLSPTTGLVTQSKNSNAQTGFNVSNTTANTGAGAYARVTGSAFLTQLLQYSASTTAYGAFVASAGGVYSTSTHLVIGDDNASGNIDFGIGTTIPKVYTMNATSFNPAVTVTNDLGTSSLAFRDVYLSHPVGKSAIGVSSGLGTNVTSVTPAGTDTYFNLTVVTSATATGTIGAVAFGRTWGATPYCVVSAANAVTGAMIASAGGYVGLNATSTTSMTLVGLFTGAGTWVFNCHCGQ